jgi:hypothetical protein
MLEFIGGAFRCCDGFSRRSFLKVGSLALGGLTLPQMLSARAHAAAAGTLLPDTSVIFVELAGGSSHFETYDPKPAAPLEFRGPLGTVATNVAGVYFSEYMIEQAKVMDRLAIVRSVHHSNSSHGTSQHLTHTGYYSRQGQKSTNDMPSVGSISARARGARIAGLPPYVSLAHSPFENAAWLGKAYNPFQVDGEPGRAGFKVRNLALDRKMPMSHLEDRRALLVKFDRLHDLADNEGVASALDQFTAQAFEMLTSDRARKAFDINGENAKTRDAYGRNNVGQTLLLARRLVEAGVTFVTVRPGGWDHHAQIAKAIKSNGVTYDRAVAALVRDLHERGLNRNVLVVAMGEFGRTPRVNNNAGRDHWGSAMSVLVAGGGLRVGQVVGSTNTRGEVPSDRPYRPENVLAMIYRHLGIDPAGTLIDLNGRPRYILEERELIRELL